MPAPTIANSKTTTATKYGGDALNNLNRYLNGVDITSTIGTPIIRTPTKIPSDILKFTDPAEDNTVSVKIPALSANKNINLIPSNVQDNDTIVFKDTVQTLTGKVIDAQSNTITNIDTTNLSASANVLTTTNTKTVTNKTFTSPVINSPTLTNSGNPLTLPTTTDTLVGRATTDTLTNKTLTSPVIATISNTGILTLPTATTTLVGRDTTDTLTNKTFNADGTGNSIFNIENADIKSAAGIIYSKLALSNSIVNADISTSAAIDGSKLINVQKDPTVEKFGGYAAEDYWEVDGTGLLKNLSGLGTFSNNIDGNGGSQRFSTGTTSGTTAGVVLIAPVATFNGWMRTNNIPHFRFKLLIPDRTSNDSRVYVGWYTDQTLLPTSNTPLDVNNGGILIGYGTTDTNIQVFYGPGDGSTTPPTPLDTGIAVPLSLSIYYFEITVNSATSIKVTIYNSSGTSLYTNTITTNLPTGTKSINFHCVIQNATATNKTITIFAGYMRSVK